MSDFIAQGGYGAYVWSAYGISRHGLGAITFSRSRAYRRPSGRWRDWRRKTEGRNLQLSETNI